MNECLFLVMVAISGDCKVCVFSLFVSTFFFGLLKAGNINESRNELESSIIIQSQTEYPLSCYSHSFPGMFTKLYSCFFSIASKHCLMILYCCRLRKILMSYMHRSL